MQPVAAFMEPYSGTNYPALHEPLEQVPEQSLSSSSNFYTHSYLVNWNLFCRQ